MGASSPCRACGPLDRDSWARRDDRMQGSGLPTWGFPPCCRGGASVRAGVTRDSGDSGIRETRKVALLPLAVAAEIHKSMKVAPSSPAAGRARQRGSRRHCAGFEPPLREWLRGAAAALPHVGPRLQESLDWMQVHGTCTNRRSRFVEVACTVSRGERIMERRTGDNTLPSGLDCRGFQSSDLRSSRGSRVRASREGAHSSTPLPFDLRSFRAWVLEPARCALRAAASDENPSASANFL